VPFASFWIFFSICGVKPPLKPQKEGGSRQCYFKAKLETKIAVISKQQIESQRESPKQTFGWQKTTRYLKKGKKYFN